MSKIKLTLPEGITPVTGKQVTFTAPCDCTAVECLQINGIDYAVVNTLGEVVTGTSGAWISGSLVTVVLDVESHYAYLQAGGSSGGGGGSGVAMRTPITLLATSWDSSKTQTVRVPHLSENEDSQLVHILPEDEDKYLSYGIIASVASHNYMKFTAETVPSEDLSVSVVVEDVGTAVADYILSGPRAMTILADVPVHWTPSGNYYYQDIAVEGMSSKFDPIVSCQYGDDQDMNAQYKEAFGLIQDVDTLDGSVRIWCTAAPEIPFTIKFNVMGWYEISQYPAAEGVAF